jgi:cytochrome c-type biogenesis protein CcmH/NrfF
MRLRTIFALFVIYVLSVLSSDVLHAAPDLEDRTREIASELRCVVCQNLSVADSPSEMAQQMRAIVREQLQSGKSPEEIKEFFVSKYGDWVLLKPKTTGFSALLWILPYVVLVVGVIAALWFIRRWTANKKLSAATNPSQVAQPLPSEWIQQALEQPNLEDSSAKAQLLRERGRLKNELVELDFDFQSGKLSESDYSQLKQEIETKGAAVIKQLSSLPPEPIVKKPKDKPGRDQRSAQGATRFRRWQLVGGGIFLMLFGLVLGVMLTKSVRTRGGENDTMTGDFLTGTTPADGEARAALSEGKTAFAHQEFPKAIEAFKKVLAADPNNPEAHSYMGFILVEAGHADGALLAFDKALSQAPNFPMALWGKGLVLYREKKDFAGAREALEKLLSLVPPGEEKNEIAKLLTEIPAGSSSTRRAASSAPAGTASPSVQISGKITIDPKLKSNLDPNAALFIIARRAGGAAGPPLAVKKIDRPTFPLVYTLGQENVMMQGTPFAGKINITVRLDKDGNPTTRGAGDMTGDYKNNPVEVGAKNADITIDQMIQ